MSDKHSRLNNFEKRRKTTKSISILLILGGILIIVLLGIWIFGGNDNKDDKASEEPKEESSDITINDDTDKDDSGDKVTKGDDSSSDQDDSSRTDDQENSDQDENKDKDEEIETEQTEPTDDNVSEAYTGDWPAVETEQEGPHTTDYNEGSMDRKEIEKASAMATGIDETSITTWWVSNGGDQKVVSTVSNADQSEIYRVFLSWIEGKGWQPAKVEKLKSLDY